MGRCATAKLARYVHHLWPLALKFTSPGHWPLSLGHTISYVTWSSPDRMEIAYIYPQVAHTPTGPWKSVEDSRWMRCQNLGEYFAQSPNLVTVVPQADARSRALHVLGALVNARSRCASHSLTTIVVTVRRRAGNPFTGGPGSAAPCPRKSRATG